MVAQTTMIPRTVTATLSSVTTYNQAVTHYNAAIAYNQPTETNGSALPRAVATATSNPRSVPTASMKAR